MVKYLAEGFCTRILSELRLLPKAKYRKVSVDLAHLNLDKRSKTPAIVLTLSLLARARLLLTCLNSQKWIIILKIKKITATLYTLMQTVIKVSFLFF